MNVLSLFDGMRCGMIALERSRIKVNHYFYSEIDKHAIKVANINYPNDISMGDVTKITKQDLLKLPKIDLLMGGSPCQGLSSSNVWLKDGEYGVDGTGASRLFWEYVRIYNELKKINPNIKFLLENVGSAKKEDQRIISDVFNKEGIKFNSRLLVPQNRNRIYWTNIDFDMPNEPMTKTMQDLLETNADAKYYLTEKMYNCVITPATKGWQSGKMDIDLEIARPLTATMHKMHRADTDNYVTGVAPLGKTNVRRLTPIECERLQGVPDNYTNHVSDTQRYRMLGNGWTVDVIAHIFKGLKNEY